MLKWSASSARDSGSCTVSSKPTEANDPDICDVRQTAASGPEFRPRNYLVSPACAYISWLSLLGCEAELEEVLFMFLIAGL